MLADLEVVAFHQVPEDPRLVLSIEVDYYVGEIFAGSLVATVAAAVGLSLAPRGEGVLSVHD
jgi:hypothetical protein